MTRAATRQNSKIFISYRSEDTAGYGRQLKEALRQRFGTDQVFWAKDSIPPGRDFEQAIKKALNSCEVLLVVIGQHWLLSAAGWNRQNDYVRLEIATALDKNVLVIPVLVQGAGMPRPDDLPDDLKQLATLQAHKLSERQRHWETDVKDLTAELKKIIEWEDSYRLAKQLALVCLALAIVISVGALRVGKNFPWPKVGGESSLLGLSGKSEARDSLCKTHPHVPIDLVPVPAHNFMMGSLNKEKNEQPVRQVTFSKDFYMGKFEVTQAQWQAVMCDNPAYFKGDDRRPVENVSWLDAQAFIKQLNATDDVYTYRLPTEAEWEYAARAGTTDDYAGDLNSIAWYGYNENHDHGNAGETTHPVGTKNANEFKLYDMYGNVGEWCQDVYHYDYLNHPPTDGSAWESGGEPSYRVVRGGSWYYGADSCRPAFRGNVNPGNRSYVFGFRVAADKRK
jgi:formylglycine-generating enzyme required for sulfatase activity